MKLVFILFASILLLVSSCKKDGNPLVPVVPVPMDSAILLKKFIVLNPLSTAPNDTVQIFDYNYDNLNRCTHITTHYGVAAIHENIFYNNNDTLMSWHERIYGASDTIREYFTYSNGQIVTDSLFNGNGINCVYHESGSITHTTTTANYLPFLKGTYFLVNRDVRRNITNSADSLFQYVSGSYNLWAIINVSVSYDDHPNPFYKLYPKRRMQVELQHAFNTRIAPFYEAIVQPNNILQENRTSSRDGYASSYSNRYTYQYNANSYPSAVRFENLLTGETFHGIYVY